ncbi:hypothetical protein P4A93_01720 [Pseudomonas syringae pv. syringae]|uniref:hypothetical protein n=1 Tax=Pseudomonas syringae TaxID=317 RepID=UPI0023F71AF1|nr:hypothetical protein [Pseudomonas syringae]MDF5890345.1 hypothetical protein [Pseudomonas syringae pv. syringae]
MAFAVIPLAATFFSILFYSEQLHMTDGIALVLVTLSIFAAESQKKTPVPPLAVA